MRECGQEGSAGKVFAFGMQSKYDWWASFTVQLCLEMKYNICNKELQNSPDFYFVHYSLSH